MFKSFSSLPACIDLELVKMKLIQAHLLYLLKLCRTKPQIWAPALWIDERTECSSVSFCLKLPRKKKTCLNIIHPLYYKDMKSFSNELIDCSPCIESVSTAGSERDWRKMKCNGYNLPTTHHFTKPNLVS